MVLWRSQLNEVEFCRKKGENMTKKISWLKIAWNLSLLYKKLPEQEKADFMEILDNKDDVGMEFFLKRHWKQIFRRNKQ